MPAYAPKRIRLGCKTLETLAAVLSQDAKA